MARQKKRTDKAGENVVDFRHKSVKRLNIPPAGLTARGDIVREKKVRYAYDPLPTRSRPSRREGKRQNLTREPEMVKAYRDTWTLRVHSYLSHLRDRLLLCKELLADTGSILVQISDENLHRVRSLLDEVFEQENSVAVIPVEKTQSQTSSFVSSICDYLLWYAKCKEYAKYHQIYLEKAVRGSGASGYTYAEHMP